MGNRVSNILCGSLPHPHRFAANKPRDSGTQFNFSIPNFGVRRFAANEPRQGLQDTGFERRSNRRQNWRFKVTKLGAAAAARITLIKEYAGAHFR